MKTKQPITVESTINAPAENVWKLWTSPEHIKKWNSPSDDWHTPRTESDLRPGGKFLSRMEAKDGGQGFDFEGTYDVVEEPKHLSYTMSDGRKVKVGFSTNGNQTKVTETFDTEEIHSLEMQQAGWQSILDNFKKYAESGA